jgi:hypothetical protein
MAFTCRRVDIYIYIYIYIYIDVLNTVNYLGDGDTEFIARRAVAAANTGQE